MLLSLKDLKPHTISRDLKGYTIFIYGTPKSGKTTTAVKFPKNLLFGFEKGYNAIPNIYVVPINSWSEALNYQNQLIKDATQVQKQLDKDPNCGAETQFSTITIDTADISFDLCEKYICNQNGVQSIGEIAYGAGWKMVEKEYDMFFRRFVNAGYGLVIISHDKVASIKDEKGQEYQKITSTLGSTPRKIVNRLCDIIGYIKPISEISKDGVENTKSYMFLRGTSKWEAGSRFKYMPDYIEFNYQNLVNSIHNAIDEEAKHGNSEFVTDEKVSVMTDNQINFEDLILQTKTLIEKMLNKDETRFFPIIKEFIELRLGTGKLLKDATRVQVEQVNMIYYDLKDYIEENSIELD